MTYSGFLLQFVGIPLLFFLIFNAVLHYRGKCLPDSLRAWPFVPVVGLHVVLALTYTTPWDNYLVAVKVLVVRPSSRFGHHLGLCASRRVYFLRGPNGIDRDNSARGCTSLFDNIHFLPIA